MGRALFVGVQINCVKCGRPVCEIDAPSFKAAEVNAVARSLRGMLGIELPSLVELANPTPEGIATLFGVRCPAGCS